MKKASGIFCIVLISLGFCCHPATMPHAFHSLANIQSNVFFSSEITDHCTEDMIASSDNSSFYKTATPFIFDITHQFSFGISPSVWQPPE
jgi:hypothetical protein